PQVPFNALPPSVFSIRLDRRPFAFTTCARFSPSRTASPAESYPLYSSFDRPSSRIGAACRFPVKPTIPHIVLSLPLFNLLYFPFYAKRLWELPESSLTLCLISLFADYIDHFINILLASIMVRCFHHDTHHRFSTGFAHQNTTSIAQCLRNLRHGFLHSRIILCSLLIGHTNILQHLRIDLQRCRQLAHRLLLSQHDF